MRRRVEVLPRAASQIRTIAAWWVENRPTAPELFVEELDRALDRIAVTPQAGSLYARSRHRGIRRVHLGRSGFHVYYSVSDLERLISVRAVWHAARGRGPALK